jgi:threonine dehydrogenase-like Zn-dependent dehydrogenase
MDLAKPRRRSVKQQMRAARFLGEGRIEIVDLPVPTPAHGEVLLQVAYCGLCGSEHRPYKRGSSLTPGHEVSGTVVDANGCDVPVGTRAVVYLSVYCGECRYCRQGLNNLCLNRAGLLGWSAPWHGGYAEYMAVPAQDILPVDPRVGLDAAVLLLDTIGTAWHALRLARAAPSDRALVIGCGPLGLGVVAGLRAFGVEEVFASDLFQARLDAAEELGARAVTPADVPTLQDVNLIVEVVGRQETLMGAVRMVAPQGRVVMLGENWEKWPFEPTGETMLKDYSLIRSWYFPISEHTENQQMMLEGKVDPGQLISHTFPLERLAEAFRLFWSGRTRKVLCGSGPSAGRHRSDDLDRSTARVISPKERNRYP